MFKIVSILFFLSFFIFSCSDNTSKNNSYAFTKLGDLYISEGNYKKAEKEYLKLLEVDSNNFNILRKLGNLYIEIGKYKEAEKEYLKLLDLDKNNLNTLLQLGNIYMLKGNNKKAEEYYLKLLKIDINNIVVIMKLGNIYLGRGDYENAKKYFNRYLSLNKEIIEGHYVYKALGFANYFLFDYKEAEIFFRKYVDINKQDIRVIEKLGKIYMSMGKYKEAEQFYKKLFVLGVTDKNILSDLRKYYFSKGEYKELLKIISTSKVIKKDKTYFTSEAIINDLLVFYQVGDFDKMIGLCEGYDIEVKKTYINKVIASYCSEAYQLTGDDNKSLEILNKLSSLYKDDIWVLLRLHRYYILNDQDSKASLYMRKVNKISKSYK